MRRKFLVEIEQDDELFITVEQIKHAVSMGIGFALKNETDMLKAGMDVVVPMELPFTCDIDNTPAKTTKQIPHVMVRKL